MDRKRYFVIGALLLLLTARCQAQGLPGYTISTVAGNYALGIGYSGDAGAATAAQLSNPCAIALDASGNLYIADQLNDRIRKVTSDGNINSIAGDGTNGYFGDTKAASSAEVYFPCGMAFDRAGNLYIADTNNNVIRKIGTNGIISTVAGDGTASYLGDNGPATVAELNAPQGVAVDSAGNIYIADTGNQRIRKVTTDGNINTVAGNGVAGYSGDGGAATGATFNSPQSIKVDAAGNMYIADTVNNAIRKVAANGIITTIAGNGTDCIISGAICFSGDGNAATSASLFHPKDIVLDAAGNLYIADAANQRIRVVAPNGIISTIAGNGTAGAGGDGGPATFAQLRFPGGLALGSGGTIYVADTQNEEIRLLTPNLPSANAPSIVAGGVVSPLAFGGFPAIAPGSWIEIYGTNLAADTRAWSQADFHNTALAPTSLDGTQVTIAGVSAYVAYISPRQVNAQVPLNVPTGAQQIAVTTANGTSAPYTVTVNQTQPGLLAPSTFQIGGNQYLAALFNDGVTYVLPTGAISGIPSRPAHVGETIVMYGVGFGPVSPPFPAGEIIPQVPTFLTQSFQVFFGQTPAATPSYYGLAPGVIGLYQFNVVVPNVPASNAVPVTFTLGGVAGTQTLYTAVQ